MEQSLTKLPPRRFIPTRREKIRFLITVGVVEAIGFAIAAIVIRILG